MSNKYRLFGKIPVADILIVVLLAAVMILAINFINQDDVQEQTGGEETEESEEIGDPFSVSLTLAVYNTGEKNVSLVEAGDKLYTEDGDFFGTVKAVRHEPFYEVHSNETGRPTKTYVEGKATLYLNVEGEGILHKNNGIYMADKHVYYTGRVKLCTEKYIWQMDVVHMDRMEVPA